jgi:glutamate synthase domain-containing protein 3
MVRVEGCSAEDERRILSLVHEHQERTGSPRARQIMGAWEEFRGLFRKVLPMVAPTTAHREIEKVDAKAQPVA